MSTYHTLTNALSAHMIHINLNMILYTHVEHSPTRTIYIKYYTEKQTHSHTHTTHAHTHTHNDCSRNWVLILVGLKILWEEEGFQVLSSDNHKFLMCPTLRSQAAKPTPNRKSNLTNEQKKKKKKRERVKKKKKRERVKKKNAANLIIKSKQWSLSIALSQENQLPQQMAFSHRLYAFKLQALRKLAQIIAVFKHKNDTWYKKLKKTQLIVIFLTMH